MWLCVVSGKRKYKFHRYVAYLEHCIYMYVHMPKDVLIIIVNVISNGATFFLVADDTNQ